MQDYGVTLFMFRTPYLVDIVRENVGRVLNLGSINAGNSWKDMDVLIFNSWHWWTHTGKSQPYDSNPWSFLFNFSIEECEAVFSSVHHRKLPLMHYEFRFWMALLCRWDYVRDGTNLYRDMDRLTAFYKGLSTWAKWVDSNVDPSKTRVFFQGISPTHYQ